MIARQTYQGIVRQGQIELTTAPDLPEGSSVTVVLQEETPLFNPHLARKKANGWLATYVGAVMAHQPQLKQKEEQLVWEFKTFIALANTPPNSYVGTICVDAYTGDILATPIDAEEMIRDATAVARSFSSSES